jgi:hypothetical protein
MPHTSYPPWVDHSNNLWRGIQILKLPINREPASTAPNSTSPSWDSYRSEWREIWSPKFKVDRLWILIQISVIDWTSQSTEYHSCFVLRKSPVQISVRKPLSDWGFSLFSLDILGKLWDNISNYVIHNLLFTNHCTIRLYRIIVWAIYLSIVLSFYSPLLDLATFAVS